MIYYFLIPLLLVCNEIRSQISNIGADTHGTNTDQWFASPKKRAAAFITASDRTYAGNITIQDAYINPFPGSGFSVSLYNSTAGGTIGSLVLSYNYLSVANGRLTYTPSTQNTILSANTKYWLVVAPTSGTFYWLYTNSNSVSGAFTLPVSNYRAYSANGTDWVYDASISSSSYSTGAWYYRFSVSITGTLPVTWQSFTAQKKSAYVELNWSTASEQNTRDFEVQHSTNTQDWSMLGTVNAAGNSTTTRQYSFIHASPIKGGIYNYYRIKQRDLDDKCSFSKIVSIRYDETGPEVHLYLFLLPGQHLE